MVIKVNEEFFIKWETVTRFIKRDPKAYPATNIEIFFIGGDSVILKSDDAENFWKEAMTATKYERLNAEIVAANIEAIVNPHQVQGVKTGLIQK